MDINFALGALGLAISVVSLAYAVYVARKSKQEKLFAYEVWRPAPLAAVFSKQSGYSLKILYEKPGQSAISVDQVVVRYVRFANLGRVPIARVDCASTDPLRIEVKGANVLDASLVTATRDVCRLGLVETKREDKGAVVGVEFDFLDHEDGGLIQIVTDGRPVEVEFKGTIIGMPEGIVKSEDAKRSGVEVSGWGCALPLMMQFLILAAVPFGYRYFVGAWTNVWLLALPVAALVVPFALFLAVLAFLTEERGKYKFPQLLVPPKWYGMGRHMYSHMDSHYERRSSSRGSDLDVPE